MSLGFGICCLPAFGAFCCLGVSFGLWIGGWCNLVFAWFTGGCCLFWWFGFLVFATWVLCDFGFWVFWGLVLGFVVFVGFRML